jgi:hypothetical protein
VSDFLSNLVTRSLNGSDAVRPQFGTIYEATLENREGFFAAEKEREPTTAPQPPNERTEHLSRVESMWQRAPETRADIRPAPAPIARASARPAGARRPTQLQVASEQHAEPRPLKRDAPDSSRTDAGEQPLPQTASPEVRAQKVLELIRRESAHSRAPGKPSEFRALSPSLPPFPIANPRVEKREDSAAHSINVTIGRVEVRATLPQPAAAEKPRAAAPITSLEEYLRERAGGNRR